MSSSTFTTMSGIGHFLIREGEPVPMSTWEILERSNREFFYPTRAYHGMSVAALVDTTSIDLWDQIVSWDMDNISVREKRTGIAQWVKDPSVVVHEGGASTVEEWCALADEQLEGLVQEQLDAHAPERMMDEQLPLTVMVELRRFN